ncbi:hypothetical protein PIB30_048697 [Stylosanthes scabra]|uniref:Uncharacterized protein n=1 Tax=Stylosanthes scabra TaxID=79078 RepID=A0ABU6SGY4_9FABA|nr:hypothetical protein [Stylosanthes scabra]
MCQFRSCARRGAWPVRATTEIESLIASARAEDAAMVAGEDNADDGGVREGLVDLKGRTCSVGEDGGYVFTLQRLHKDVCALAGLAGGKGRDGWCDGGGVVVAEGGCSSGLF